MSISNRHPLNPFTSGASQALAGQRLAKIGYKSSKTAPARYPSVCASIPPIDSAEVSARIVHRMESFGVSMNPRTEISQRYLILISVSMCA